MPIPNGSIADGALGSLERSVEVENLVHVRAQGLWYAMRDGETLQVQLAEILELIRQNLDEQGARCRSSAQSAEPIDPGQRGLYPTRRVI